MSSNSVALMVLKFALATSVPVATVSFAHRSPHIERSAAESAPDAPIVEVEDPQREFPISSDGAFYANTSVNGKAVRMMVDSGANMTVLSRSDARRIGISPPRAAFNGTLLTANGSIPAAQVDVTSFTVAGKTFHHFRVVVIRDNSVLSLLGNNALETFRKIAIADGVMELDA